MLVMGGRGPGDGGENTRTLGPDHVESFSQRSNPRDRQLVTGDPLGMQIKNEKTGLGTYGRLSIQQFRRYDNLHTCLHRSLGMNQVFSYS